MNLKIKIQLCLMMFLQFCVWGAWYGQMGKYLTLQLHATGDQVGNAYAGFSIAMIIAPFFMGMLADRFFPAQKLLGVLNLIGAALLFWITKINDANTFFWAMLLYCLTFAPSIALTSSIALRQMLNPEKEFSSIRLFGTLAWIFIVNVVGFMGIGDTVNIFYLSLMAALVMGLFSFTLPDTKPIKSGPVGFLDILGKEAFILLRDRNFTIFFIASIGVCIPLSFYYTWANSSLTDSYIHSFPAVNPGTFKIENLMSLGQMSEILFLLILPFIYTRYGVKKILIIGLLAWIIRFVCFGIGNAEGNVWMFYLAIILHGICYDFFFITGQIYTDQKAGMNIKSQAQGLISLATYGVGMLIGSIIAGKVKDIYTSNGHTDWLMVWMVPAGIAFFVLLLFLFFFRDEKGKF